MVQAWLRSFPKHGLWNIGRRRLWREVLWKRTNTTISPGVNTGSAKLVGLEDSQYTASTLRSAKVETHILTKTPTIVNGDTGLSLSKHQHRRQSRPITRQLRNLDPSKLQSIDCIEFTFGHRANLSLDMGPLCQLGFVSKNAYAPVLQGANKFQGFLYFMRNPGGLGEVRLRVTSTSNPSDFDRGEDLRRLSGDAWRLPLLSIISAVNYESIMNMLLSQKLINQEDLNRCHTLRSQMKSPPRIGSHFLYYLEEPFYLDISRMGISFHIIDNDAVGQAEIKWIFTEKRAGYRDFNPYAGSIKVRFEHSTLPEHANTDALCLRVLEFVTPIRSQMAKYDSYVHPPRIGELVTRGYAGESRPWSLNIDKDTVCDGHKDLRMLLTKPHPRGNETK